MARNLSVNKRRVGLVDISFPERVGAKSYQFFAASNWDAASTAFQIVPAAGMRSLTAPDVSAVGSQFRGKTRFVFNPADYTLSVAAVDDTKPFYLTIQQTNWDGTVLPVEAQHLVLPYNPAPNRPLVLRGVAPSGASIANSLELQLPMQCRNFRVQNDGAVDAFIAFEPTGAEVRVPPLSTSFMDLVSVMPSMTQLFMRGSGGTTTISVLAEIHNNR